jgi:polysaccharide pyruvyl transferase WcaK-like protein
MADLAPTLKSRLRHHPVVSHVSRGLKKRIEPGLHWMGTHLGRRTGRCFSQPANYFVRNRVAGYIGWVGNGNIGDEAIFLAFRRLFPRHQAVLFDRAPFELLLHRRFVAGEPFHDFVTLGGGTLFSFRCYYYQLDAALRHGVPVWTFGTGVDDPELMKPACCGPSEAPLREQLSLLRDFAGLLKDVPMVTVRGPRTARVLRQHGVHDTKVIGDPALGACTPGPLAGGRRAAVNLAMWKNRGGPDMAKVVGAVRSAIQYLLDKGWEVDFIPTARGDRVMGRMLVHGQFGDRVQVLPEIASPIRFIERLKTYDLTIGERLHSLVLSAGSGVPSIGLEYSPKCRDFMESLGMERFSLDTRHITPDSLIAAVDEADNTREQLNRTLNERCNAYRRMQRDSAAHVTKLISPVPTAEKTPPQLATTP